jgi:hypothetical protein
MAEYQKVFIGSGKRVKDYDMVECSVEYNKLQPFEYNGKMYVKFTVAGKKDGADKWGKTHSVSISRRVDDGNPTNNMSDVQNPVHAPAPPDYPEEEINPEDIPF